MSLTCTIVKNVVILISFVTIIFTAGDILFSWLYYAALASRTLYKSNFGC